MKEEQTILNASNQADNEYLNNLAVAVCINGDKLDKYKKIVTKKYGEDVYKNLKQFVNEQHEYLKRKKVTNTSKVNLTFLGKNAGLNEATIDKIIRHVESKIKEKGNTKWIKLISLITNIISKIWKKIRAC